MPKIAPHSALPALPDHVSVGEVSSGEVSSKGKRFPKASRLLRHADFDRVYKQGKRHFSTNMTVFFLPRTDPPSDGLPSTDPPSTDPPPDGLRIGLTVSRALGGAVDRNRMRRRLREAVRMTRPVSAPAIDVVINPKRLVLKAEFDSVVKEVGRAFDTVLRKSAGGEK